MKKRRNTNADGMLAQRLARDRSRELDHEADLVKIPCLAHLRDRRVTPRGWAMSASTYDNSMPTIRGASLHVRCLILRSPRCNRDRCQSQLPQRRQQGHCLSHPSLRLHDRFQARRTTAPSQVQTRLSPQLRRQQPPHRRTEPTASSPPTPRPSPRNRAPTSPLKWA